MQMSIGFPLDERIRHRTTTGSCAVTSPVRLSWGARTDRGHVRPDNQDAFLADQTVFVVADGMGGHANGGLAAQYAVQAVAPLVGLSAVTSTQVHECLVDASERIAAIDPSSPSPAGTTFTGAFVTIDKGVPHWMVVNIGDSRTYLMRDRRMEQLTVDHSEVQELLDAGAITAEQAAGHPHRNIITRALGLEGGSREDVWMVPIRVGDRLLVCSDGITNELSDDLLRDFLRAPDPDDVVASGVVDAALEAGGGDNATAVVVTAEPR